MRYNELLMRKMWEWRIPNFDDIENLIAFWTAKYETFHDKIVYEFGPNGFYILFLFALFLFIITVIYIKSVFDTFRFTKNKLSSQEENEGLFYVYDESEENIDESDDEHKKREMEKELSKDLIRMSELTNDYLHLSEDYERLKSIMKKHAEVEYEKMQEKKKENINNQNINTKSENGDNISEHTDETSSMMYLLINMLSRNISEPKIAQVLYKKYSDSKTPEDIIQIIKSVRDFLGLCNTGKFDSLPNRNSLPSTYEALLALANGDNSLCLDLLKELTKHCLDLADEQKGIIQSFTYSQAANYACLAGTLAGLDNMALAKDSYTLATELSPENVNAWSRVGDSLTAENNKEKAMFAYQTVLDYGDTAMYSTQIANAKSHLSKYYFDQGVVTKAEKLLNESQRFYSDYGINNDLTEKENETISFLESEDRANMHNHITKLLSQKDYF